MKKEQLNPKLEQAFKAMQETPERNRQMAMRGRLKFLQQAEKLRQGVSADAKQRHKGWNSIFPFLSLTKEKRFMKPLISISLALALFLGASAATVYAAQDDLPGQALYQVKTWSEDAALSLPFSTETRLNYALDLSDRRIAEIGTQVIAGEPVSEQLVTRLQTHLELALQLAAELDEPLMNQGLENIRTRSEIQTQTMTMLMTNAPDWAQPVLERIRERTRTQVELATLGQTDPLAFKLQVQQRTQQQQQVGSGEPAGPNGPQNQTGAGEPGPNGTQVQNQTGAGEPGPNGTQVQSQTGTGESQATEAPVQNGPGEPQPTEVPAQIGPGEPQPTDVPGDLGPGEPQQTPQTGKSSSKP